MGGVCQCPVHGLCGGNLVCIHIQNRVDVTKSKMETFHCSDELIDHLHLCRDCEAKHKNLTGKPLEDFHDNVTSVCAKCFYKWRDG
jgi:hypothetical protein